MATRIKIRRDTATNWSVNNPTLAQGEEGFETDTRKRKIGNGSTAWNSLPYEVHISDVATPTLAEVIAAGNTAGDPVDMNGYAIRNVANPVGSTDAANKAYVDQKALNVFRLAGSIDCSTNPNYPNASKGDRFEVTVAGKIGGPAGINVQAWDEIVCTENTFGGTQDEVGSLFYITQANVLEATEDVSGTMAIATEAEMAAGTVTIKAVTVSKLTYWLNNVLNTIFQTLSGKNANNGYVGLSGFMIAFKNAANTFTSYLSNSNTASRTYGFPDKNGTIAMLDDIPTKAIRKIFHSAHADFTGSSTITEEVYEAILIPGGTVSDGDSIDVEALWTFASTSGSQKQFRMRAHNAIAIAGTVFANIQNNNATGTTIPVKLKQDLKMKVVVSPAQTIEAAYTNTAASSIGVLTVFVTGNIDLTQDWYILITGQKAVVGDTMKLKYANCYINKL
jgi:hypothetical protein